MGTTNVKDLRSEQFAEVCNQLLHIFEKKNSDYGDDFFTGGHGSDDEFLNIKRKFARLKTMYEFGEPHIKVSDETLDDTLKDLANYCIMTIIKRRVARDEPKNS